MRAICPACPPLSRPTLGPDTRAQTATPLTLGEALEKAPEDTCASLSSSIKRMWSSHSTPMMKGMWLPRDWGRALSSGKHHVQRGGGG